MRLIMRLLIAAAAVLPLAATTITFDQIANSMPNEPHGGYVQGTAVPLTIEGYRLAARHYHIVDTLDCSFGGCVGFTGSQYLALDSEEPYVDMTDLELSREDGGRFQFIGFDASGLFNDDAAAVAAGFGNVESFAVWGYRLVDPDSSPEAMWFSDLVLPPTPGSRTFRFPGENATVDTVVFFASSSIASCWAIDNIVLSETPLSNTPEPSGMTLAALALIGIVWTSRRRS